MPYQLTPGVPLHTIIFCVTVSLGFYAITEYRRQQSQPELLPFIWLMFGISLGQIAAIVISIVPLYDIVLWAYNISNIFIVPIMTFSFVSFCLHYAGYHQSVNMFAAAAATLNIIVLSGIILYNPLFLYDVHTFSSQGPINILNFTFTEWLSPERHFNTSFTIYQIYNFIIVFLGISILLKYIISNYAVLGSIQSLAILFAVIIPILVQILLAAGIVPRFLDPLMLSFGASAIGFAVATFRYRVFNLSPAGREQVVEDMDDYVIVLTDELTVADANPAARSLFDEEKPWRGMPAKEFFGEDVWKIKDLMGDDMSQTRMSRDIGGHTRHFDLQVSPVRGVRSSREGTLVVLRDITSLKEREEELDLLRQILSRVLRHNIRNNIDAIKGYTRVISEDLDGKEAELAERIILTADDLVAVSDKARSVETLVETDQDPTNVDLINIIEQNVDSSRSSFPEITFQTDMPASCTVRTIPAVEQLIANLIENAAEHNTTDEPSVHVRVIDKEDTVTITIRDNGPGIPDHELAVLEKREEEQLQHGSGVGLWLVDWVVRNSTASVEYETAETGTTVTVTIRDEQLNEGSL